MDSRERGVPCVSCSSCNSKRQIDRHSREVGYRQTERPTLVGVGDWIGERGGRQTDRQTQPGSGVQADRETDVGGLGDWIGEREGQTDR